MSRFSCGMGIVLLLGCSGSPSIPEASIGARLQFNRDEAMQTLTAQAEEFGQAILAEDHAKLVDQSHPKIVALTGGREQMINLLKLTAKGMKKTESSIRAVEFGAPSGIAAGGQDLFGIVPFTLEITVGKIRGRRKSFLIGVSSNAGKKWLFVDGGQADATKVKQLFANFPDRLQLPEKLAFIVPDTN